MPDALRPTELHDFGNVFGPGRTRRATALLAAFGALAVMAGAAHVVSAASASADPVVVVAAR